MNKNIRYLLDILKHKKRVFKICWKNKLYLHAFAHDISKFYPSEFINSAEWFYGRFGVNSKGFINVRKQTLFEDVVNLHRYRNKHHPEYWYKRKMNMPYKYIIQMMCDIEADALENKLSVQEYYLKNYDNICLCQEDRLCLEANLGLIPLGFNDPCIPEYYMTLEEISNKRR